MKFQHAITPYGRWILATAILLLVLGVLGGWLELLTIGAALMAMAIVSFFMVLGGQPYEVDVQLRKDRVVAGERAMVLVTFRNTTNHRIRSATLEIPVKDSLHRATLPSIPPGDEHEVVISIQTSVRSVVPIGPVMTVRGDPFGILARRVRWSGITELFVHPKTVLLSANLLGATHDLDGFESDDPADMDLNFHTLREYEPGDDRRSIHWRSSAKAGNLLVKQYAMSQRTDLLIRIDHDVAHYANVAEQEEAVSVAASLALSTLRSGGGVEVMWQNTILPAATPIMLLDSLAGIEFGKYSPERKHWLSKPAALAFLVSGSTASFSNVQDLGRPLPPTVPRVGIRTGADTVVRRSATRGFTFVDGLTLANMRKEIAQVTL